MSFYRRPPAMGFAWIAPVAQFVGGAMKSQPVEGEGLIPQQPQSSALTIAAALGGLAITGGLLYFVWRSR